MENKEFPRLYHYSREEAKRQKELECWTASHAENIACRNAIEIVSCRGMNGARLEDGCVQGVIAEFGYQRVKYVLANSIRQKSFDPRISQANLTWAKQIYVPVEKDRHGRDYNCEFAVNSLPTVLDDFANQYRSAYQALGLFDSPQCIANTGEQDFEGKVIVLSPDVLKESCLAPENQLWLCTGGFGSRASARGRAVYATCLGDGERTCWNRSDFAGVLADSHLPDWAREKLEQLTAQTQAETTELVMGGLTMQ